MLIIIGFDVWASDDEDYGADAVACEAAIPVATSVESAPRIDSFIDEFDKEGVLAVVQNVLQAYPPKEEDDYVQTQVGDDICGFMVESLLPESLGHIARATDGTLLVAMRGVMLASGCIETASSGLMEVHPIRYNTNDISGNIHAGFWDLYNTRLKKAIQNALMEVHRGKAGRLVLAGHSMGGDWASIGHLQTTSMAKLNRMNARVDTLAIGSPAIFGEDLVSDYTTKVGDSFGKICTFKHVEDKISDWSWIYQETQPSERMFRIYELTIPTAFQYLSTPMIYESGFSAFFPAHKIKNYITSLEKLN